MEEGGTHSNTWLRVNQEITMKNTTVPWDSGYSGAESALSVKCERFSEPDPKHRAPNKAVPLVPSPTSIYWMHLAINTQCFRWTHDTCKIARALPHFAFSQALLWIWWTKPKAELIQIHQILPNTCFLSFEPGHQREHQTTAVQRDFLI